MAKHPIHEAAEWAADHGVPTIHEASSSAEGEDIEVIETTLQQAGAMISSGEIIDAKTVILIQCLTGRNA